MINTATGKATTNPTNIAASISTGRSPSEARIPTTTESTRMSQKCRDGVGLSSTARSVRRGSSIIESQDWLGKEVVWG
ncbi:hypothetical protein GCM10025772_13500 [Ferrimonas gelatinilytica]|uniref:Uncharacterized protein n=1 Tax=Ferrimonas gelatinilytica TaxID=1255257 RepID=A0ABP9S358_9GAMM